MPSMVTRSSTKPRKRARRTAAPTTPDKTEEPTEPREEDFQEEEEHEAEKEQTESDKMDAGETQAEEDEEMSETQPFKSEAPETPQTSRVPESFLTTASPARSVRLGEKQALQELNHRLEFYIMKQRENESNREVMSRELLRSKKEADKKMRRVESEYRRTLDEMRDDRNVKAERISDLEGQNNALLVKARNLEEQLLEEKGHRDMLESRNSTLQKENGSLKQKFLEAENRLQKLDIEKNKLERDLATKRHRLETLEEKAVVDSRALAELRTQREKLEQEYSMLQQKYDTEKASLSQEVDRLIGEKAQLHKKLSTTFSNQFEQILAERQTQAEKEKASITRDLKMNYELKIKSMHERLVKEGHEKARLQDENRRLSDETDEYKSQFQELRDARNSLEKQVLELREKLRASKDQPSKNEQSLLSQIRAMKEAYILKEQEYDSLVDIKVALANEIKAYQLMLDNEETRLGYESPAKHSRKRRRTQSDGALSQSANGVEPDITPGFVDPALRIHSVNVEDGIIRILNTTDADVQLSGWQLRDDTGGAVFSFHNDHSISAGADIIVRVGSASDVNEGEILWEFSVWEHSPKQLCLFNGDQLVDTFDVPPSNAFCLVM